MPACKSCGVDVQAAYDQVDAARRKLTLLQEKITLDQELLRQDKKNFKRRLQAAKAAVKKSQAEVDAKQRELEHAHESARKTRRDQDWRQIQELRDELKQQEMAFKKERTRLEDRITILQSSHSKRDLEQASAVSESAQKMQEAESAVRRLEAQLARKNMTLESYEVQFRELTATTKQQQNEKSSQQANDQKYAALTAQVQRLGTSLEQRTETIQALEDELSKMRRDKEAAVRQVETHVRSMNDKAKEIQQLQAQVDDLTTKCESLTLAQTNIRQEFNASEASKEDLQKQLQELKKENEALQAEKETWTKNKGSVVVNGSHADNQETPKMDNGKMVMEFEWQGSEQLFGVYTGSLNENDNPHGSGTLRADDGAVYDGEWKDGKRHGQGVYATVDGDLYRGAWKDDQHHGKGTFVWGDGRVYRGDYVHGERHGQGVMCWPHGAHYQGEFAHNKRNGKGQYTHPDGRLYSGEYKDDRPHGQGSLKDADGQVIFEGQWELGEQMS